MDDLSKYYALLKDPARRKIIEILGTQEKIGFKELRETLGLGVGTVYYHLDMLSEFLTQDKQRKYHLNERGQMLYRVLKEGEVPPALGLEKTFSHHVGKWVFLSPVFAKTVKTRWMLLFTVGILVFGAVGTAYARLDPALFFYLRFSTYSYSTIALLYFFNWIGLFLLSGLLTFALYRRVGNDLQMLACIGIAAFPLALFPYLFVALPYAFPSMSLSDLNVAGQYIMVALQIWSLILYSSALCFGKGLRLDRAIVISLAVIYMNIAILFLLGKFV
jgi:DNA-binding transcriptional ArsR family regulator